MQLLGSMDRNMVDLVAPDLLEARDKVKCGHFLICLQTTGQDPPVLLIKALVVG